MSLIIKVINQIIFKLKSLIYLIISIVVSKILDLIYSKLHSVKLYPKKNIYRNIDENCVYILILAGPYIYRDKFTDNTIDSILKSFPNCVVILSTNSNITKVDSNNLYKKGVKKILINDFKTFNIDDVRLGNLSNQINNIKSALNYIKSESLDHLKILRQRTDQRLYHENFFKVFEIYQKFYDSLNEKIISPSFNSFINRPFSISDMLMFGNFETINCYWSLNEIEIMKAIENLEENSFQVFPESILNCNFYMKKYNSYPKDFDDYIKQIREQFIIVNADEIELFWHKIKNNLNGKNSVLKELKFSDWLNIVNQ